jgi:hypothetical protein
VVDAWLIKYAHWGNIKAVILYGDPQWYQEYAVNQGLILARLGLARILFNGERLPYVPPGHVDRWESLCLPGDPVCGESDKYSDDPVSHARQVHDATACSGQCPHLQYVKNGATSQGGKFLALRAFG